jgi:hypothetical protein
MTRQDGKSVLLRLVDDFDKNDRQYIQIMAGQIIELKNRKDKKNFKDAVFLEGEKIAERVYGI